MYLFGNLFLASITYSVIQKFVDSLLAQ